MNLGWILGGIIAVLILVVIGIYNSLVRLRNQVRNAWSQIDVQLKRRSDLIPNLVESVKGYMKHEKTVLENVTKARTAFLSASTIDGKAKASDALSKTLKSLFAVSENYPQLKANENFLQLQEEISGTENKIAYARQNYNDTAMTLNTRIESFPSNIFAGIFRFTKEALFEAPSGDRENVKVEF